MLLLLGRGWEDWAAPKERDLEENDRSRTGPWHLVLERQINLSVLRGEQDSQNKISYSEWFRNTKDHIKGKGKSGRLLVSIMEFAERLGDTHVTEDVLTKLGLAEDTVKQVRTKGHQAHRAQQPC